MTETSKIIKTSISRYFSPLKWLYKIVTSSKESIPVDEDSESQPEYKMKIMLVDDSENVREVVSSLLIKNGYEVITEPNGIAALEDLQKLSPDLVLLDIEMPKMDGFEVARRMRQSETFGITPIIMLSSKNHTPEQAGDLPEYKIVQEDDNASILEAIHTISLLSKT